MLELCKSPYRAVAEIIALSTIGTSLATQALLCVESIICSDQTGSGAVIQTTVGMEATNAFDQAVTE